MRTLSKLIATAAVMASATAMAVGPALADPINGSGSPVTPKQTDIVGVGSDTSQNVVDQLMVDYNKSHSTEPEDWPGREHRDQEILRANSPPERLFGRRQRAGLQHEVWGRQALLHRLRPFVPWPPKCSHASPASI